MRSLRILVGLIAGSASLLLIGCHAASSQASPERCAFVKAEGDPIAAADAKVKEGDLRLQWYWHNGVGEHDVVPGISGSFGEPGKMPDQLIGVVDEKQVAMGADNFGYLPCARAQIERATRYNRRICSTILARTSTSSELCSHMPANDDFYDKGELGSPCLKQDGSAAQCEPRAIHFGIRTNTSG